MKAYWESGGRCLKYLQTFFMLHVRTLLNKRHAFSYCICISWDERTYFMKYVSFLLLTHGAEVYSHPASQEIPRLLWNQKVHYSVPKSPPLASIQRQMNPVHIFPPYFPKIHSNIILPFTTRSSEWSLPFRFSKHNTVCLSLCHAYYIPLPFHPS